MSTPLVVDPRRSENTLVSSTLSAVMKLSWRPVTFVALAVVQAAGAAMPPTGMRG